MTYQVVVGLEVHVQLRTQTKIFCGCPNRFNPHEPNTQVCPVCLGLPGALPVMNQEAYRLSVKTALALHCEIARFTKWDRKQYYYPDLPKGYQISQYDLPLSHDGWLEAVSENGTKRKIRIRRAHLEEDAGKNLHDESGRSAESQVDLNRAGTPLLEIVTEPDIHSAAEAKSFLEEMHLLLTYLGVSDCNMQEGSLRCDANVNLRLGENQEIATPIVEVKNLNTFRGVEAAVEYEVRRQLKEYEETGRKLGDPGVDKETRGWDANKGVTFGQRGKEEAADYRYFPDPDLLPVTISEELLEEIRAEISESPAQQRQRFQQELGLSEYDSDVIINQGPQFTRYFESVVAICDDAKQAANWVTQDLLREWNARGGELGEFAITSEILGGLLQRVKSGTLTVQNARIVFGSLLEEADEGTALQLQRIDQLIEEKGLTTVSDTGLLEQVIAEAMAESPQAVEDLKAGKQQAIGALIGKVRKQIKGADAKEVRELILKKIQAES